MCSLQLLSAKHEVHLQRKRPCTSAGSLWHAPTKSGVCTGTQYCIKRQYLGSRGGVRFRGGGDICADPSADAVPLLCFEMSHRCTPGSWPLVPQVLSSVLPPTATTSCACWVSSAHTSHPAVVSAWRPLLPWLLLVAQPLACPCPLPTPSPVLLLVEALQRAGGAPSTGSFMARCWPVG